MDEKKQLPFRDDIFVIDPSPPGLAHLGGTKCHRCDHVAFPQSRICPNCYSDDKIENIMLSRRGKLYAFTVVRWPKIAPEGHQAPYAFGYVDLPEKVRVLTLLVASDLNRLKNGMEVELETYKFYEDSEGNDVISFRFRGR